VLPEPLARWNEHVGSRVELLNTYGLTEATILSTMCPLTSTRLPRRNGEKYRSGALCQGSKCVFSIATCSPCRSA